MVFLYFNFYGRSICQALQQQHSTLKLLPLSYVGLNEGLSFEFLRFSQSVTNLSSKKILKVENFKIPYDRKTKDCQKLLLIYTIVAFKQGQHLANKLLD